MGRIMESVTAFNTTVRTLLMAIGVTGFGAAAYYVYLSYSERDRLLTTQKQELEIAGRKLLELETQLADKQATIDRLQTAMHLLKTDHRLARIDVVKIERDEKGKAISSELEFVELSPHGDSMSEPKRIKLPGDIVYVDNWIVKFDDKYIEKGDVERGTSLCLFRRIFSEQQSPEEGFSLDEVGMRPQAYARGGSMSEFEKQLWTDFWEFSNDTQKASEMGIRAANGEAVSVKVREGKSYNISLRASDGLSVAAIDRASDK